MPSFQSSCKINRGDVDALVVRCSDHRFRPGVCDFLENGLKLGEFYDQLVIPGGPQCLTLMEYLPKFAWASGKWFRFLVDVHELKRLILIAHQDCGWYKSLPGHLHSSATPRERQEEDLRRAHRSIAREFPEMQIELYYAGWNSEDNVIVETVNS